MNHRGLSVSVPIIPYYIVLSMTLAHIFYFYFCHKPS